MTDELTVPGFERLPRDGGFKVGELQCLCAGCHREITAPKQVDLLPTGLNLKGGFKVGALAQLAALSSDNYPPKVRGLTKSIIIFDGPGWMPGFKEQAESRITRPRIKIKVKVVKRGLGYTKAGLQEPIPLSWVFRTRRAAKKFFSLPLKVKNVKQVVSAYGSPTGRIRRDQPEYQELPRT